MKSTMAASEEPRCYGNDQLSHAALFLQPVVEITARDLDILHSLEEMKFLSFFCTK